MPARSKAGLPARTGLGTSSGRPSRWRRSAWPPGFRPRSILSARSSTCFGSTNLSSPWSGFSFFSTGRSKRSIPKPPSAASPLPRASPIDLLGSLMNSFGVRNVHNERHEAVTDSLCKRSASACLRTEPNTRNPFETSTFVVPQPIPVVERWLGGLFSSLAICRLTGETQIETSGGRVEVVGE
jgi:hypothetical protein